jgi:phage-related protein
MPETSVVFYQEKDGSVPLLDWFDSLQPKVQDKCRIRIERLQELGYELRRPEADLLRDGIYELRVRHQRVNYRMLYFFHGNVAAVLSHGITKERLVPAKEIDKAIENKKRFTAKPEDHTYEETE